MEPESMTTFFGQDHDRLDDLLTQFHQLKRSDCAKAKACFVEFKAALQRHICGKRTFCFRYGKRARE
jgi:hypothetical protein